MASLSNKVTDFLDGALSGSSAAEVGANFFELLRPFGARAIFARAYGAPGYSPAEEHILARVSPPGWEALYAERRFQDCNYLARELPYRSAPFCWSEIRLLSPEERMLSRTLKDCGFPDGLAIPAHGPMGYAGVISLAFERIEDIAPQDREAR